MQTKTNYKMLSVLLIFSLIFTLLPSTVWAVDPAPNAADILNSVGIRSTVADGVYWSSTISDVYIAKSLIVGDEVTLSSMGLFPYAVSNGVYSYSFTWTSSSTSVATVDSSSGTITALKEGTTLITGTSTAYTSNIGQLMILVLVTNEEADYTLVGIKETVDNVTIDRTASFRQVGETLMGMGYYDSRVYGTNSLTDPTMTAALFACYMANSEILYFRGHGTQSRIALNAAQNVNFRCSYVDELPANVFSNCRLVLYASCSTGKGGPNATNLVNSTANRGAGTVVGFETTVISTEVDKWSEYFFYALTTGDTVEEACRYADTELWDNRRPEYYNPDGILGTQTWRVAGNGSATFN